MALARKEGKIDRPQGREDISRVEKSVQTLRKRLKSFFGIQEDPFEDYRRIGRYQTRFKISFPGADKR